MSDSNPPKLGPITRIQMPRRWDGRAVPVPIRYGCGLGHCHISRRQAIKCRNRWRDQQKGN